MMSDISAEELARVNSFPKLVALLRDKLEWPIDEDYEFEDVIFEYDPHELGLKEEETAKIREIHQLRPLVTNQPWGVFFISFEEKQLSVTVLRRILRALVVKQRGAAVDRQAWDKSDLIFAANFGKSGERELAFVHFSDGADTGDLPVMKVLGWNAKDTKLHNDYAAQMLTSRLAWPDDESDDAAWRKQWSSVFEIGHRQVIKTSRDLALHLAGLATQIRGRANELLEAEADDGPMRTMLEAFRKNLIHDLNEDGFADMFAQTICYGMLAAAISRESGALVADNMADMVPRTNPFLKELFANFLKLGGRDKRSNLDFDELGVREVVDMLRSADMPAVLRDFGDRNPKEDPVIHFYELFLREYDPAKRMQRGVFYTPRPVVNYIVRGVDEILRTEFDLPLGLADTTTWGELAARNDKITVPDHIDPDQPFVQILDPATGTGTFLVEVIDLIHKRMVKKWQGEGKSKAEIAEAWNEYVPAHLLSRLTAFELMMAPYSIAHMKVGLKLTETGYKFGSDERARIFLTNALEPAKDLNMQFDFMSAALAHEAKAANQSKDKVPFTVVIGNPPYSLISGNLSDDNRELVERYKTIEGNRIKERGALQFEKIINDDCIKFYALAERIIASTGYGTLGYISNNNFIDSPVLRGMRYSLSDSFSRCFILNLGGSVKRALGQADENVFDIQQGVCISNFLLNGREEFSVSYLDLHGERSTKYEYLIGAPSKPEGSRNVDIIPPFYFFNAKQSEGAAEYFHYVSVKDVFPLRSIGFFSSKDSLVISYDESEVVESVTSFRDSDLDNDALCEAHSITAKKAWNVTRSRQQLTSIQDISERVIPFRNRVFDEKYVFYDRSLIWSMAWPVNQHLLNRDNLALTVSRQLAGTDWRHCFCSDSIVELCYQTNKTKEGNHVAPLWLSPADGEKHRRPNVSMDVAIGIEQVLGLSYRDGIPRGEQQSMGADYRHQKAEQIGLLDQPWDGRGDLEKDFGPRDLFDWIYAILHAPSYRSRYAEYLKSDFPRVPIPKDRDTFAALVPLGRRLVALHLVKPEEEPILKNPDIRFAGTGEARVEKGYPKYTNGKVAINASRWFEDVPTETWEFHIGGYQVCDKWLKDRAGKGGKNPRPGRVLTDDDILHYRRVVTALSETRQIMAQIDEAIETHGGWLGAFSIGSDPEEAE